MRLLRNLFRKVDELLTGLRVVDDSLFDELEEALVQGDLNVHTSIRIVNRLREWAHENRINDPEQVRLRLANEIESLLSSSTKTTLAESEVPPTVYLVVGVNGTGKTTSIAKLAYRLKSRGKRVILAAADTFRAAAIDQLEIWADRIGVEIVKQQEGADPAAVVFDAVRAAKSRRADFVIADTAGRMHTKRNLMEELKKIGRVVEREIDRNADEVLLVLDATTGQNAINQAREFMVAVPVTGVLLSKLDGTAKGGSVVTLSDELGLPIKLVGTGEKLSDLEEFDAADFARSLLA